jgi:hypothetical protein
MEQFAYLKHVSLLFLFIRQWRITFTKKCLLGLMYEICALVTRGSPPHLSVCPVSRAAIFGKTHLLQKDLINNWLNLPMDEAIEVGIQSLALAYATDEPQKAIAAFW